MILHIVRSNAWKAAEPCGSYRAASLETEGFIHCSAPEQVVRVANARFVGQRDLVVLCIDPDSVEADIRWEEAEDGDRYPHVYGPLNVSAVRAAVPFPCDSDGRFTLPAQLSGGQ